MHNAIKIQRDKIESKAYRLANIYNPRIWVRGCGIRALQVLHNELESELGVETTLVLEMKMKSGNMKCEWGCKNTHKIWYFKMEILLQLAQKNLGSNTSDTKDTNEGKP